VYACPPLGRVGRRGFGGWGVTVRHHALLGAMPHVGGLPPALSGDREPHTGRVPRRRRATAGGPLH
jgi:hypothetical protein